MSELLAAVAHDELLILPRGKVRLHGIDFDEDFLSELVARHTAHKIRAFLFAIATAAFWTSHATVDKLKPQFEARSNASGLTPPRWLWRRVRL
jgi:hypothetical protein